MWCGVHELFDMSCLEYEDPFAGRFFLALCICKALHQLAHLVPGLCICAFDLDLTLRCSRERLLYLHSMGVGSSDIHGYKCAFYGRFKTGTMANEQTLRTSILSCVFGPL